MGSKAPSLCFPSKDIQHCDQNERTSLGSTTKKKLRCVAGACNTRIHDCNSDKKFFVNGHGGCQILSAIYGPCALHPILCLRRGLAAAFPNPLRPQESPRKEHRRRCLTQIRAKHLVHCPGHSLYSYDGLFFRDPPFPSCRDAPCKLLCGLLFLSITQTNTI